MIGSEKLVDVKNQSADLANQTQETAKRMFWFVFVVGGIGGLLISMLFYAITNRIKPVKGAIEKIEGEKK